MGRRWAATYIFHLGQIQLSREGGDEKRQQLTERASEPNSTTHDITKRNAILSYVQRMLTINLY